MHLSIFLENEVSKPPALAPWLLLIRLSLAQLGAQQASLLSPQDSGGFPEPDTARHCTGISQPAVPQWKASVLATPTVSHPASFSPEWLFQDTQVAAASCSPLQTFEGLCLTRRPLSVQQPHYNRMGLLTANTRADPHASLGRRCDFCLDIQGSVTMIPAPTVVYGRTGMISLCAVPELIVLTGCWKDRYTEHRTLASAGCHIPPHCLS